MKTKITPEDFGMPEGGMFGATGKALADKANTILDAALMLKNREIEELKEKVELLANHHANCECWCMDFKAIAKEKK